MKDHLDKHTQLAILKRAVEGNHHSSADMEEAYESAHSLIRNHKLAPEAGNYITDSGTKDMHTLSLLHQHHRKFHPHFRETLASWAYTVPGNRQRENDDLLSALLKTGPSTHREIENIANYGNKEHHEIIKRDYAHLVSHQAKKYLDRGPIE